MSTSTTTADLPFLGNRARIHCGAATGTPGLGLVEMIDMPPGDMPPLHVHPRHDEGFYVLDGEITVFEPGAARALRAGEFAMTSRGVPHTYRVGDAPARALVTSAPGGFEAFVAAVAALDEVTPERLTAVAGEHDIEILGPPGALPE